MTTPDTQTIERVAKAIHGPHFPWETENEWEKHQCRLQARAHEQREDSQDG